MSINNDDSFNYRMKKKILGGNRVWADSSRPALPLGNAFGSGSYRANLKNVEIISALGHDECGIVWTDLPNSAFPKPGSFVGNNPEIDHVGIHGALVFADRFDMPTNSGIDYSSATREYLRRHGVLSAETFCQYDGDASEMVRKACFATFVARDRDQPGSWAIGRGAQTLHLPVDELSGETSFSVLLSNALPIFTGAVELDQVLEFKLRRRDEFAALRKFMKGLCERVGNEGVDGLAASQEFLGFDRALADHMRVMSESNWEKVVASFRASVSWDIAIPAGFEAVLDQTVTSSGILGAGALVLVNTARGLRRKKSLSPFEYLTTVNHELG